MVRIDCRMTKNTDRVRFNLELTPAEVEAAQRIQERLGAASLTEIIRRSVRVLDQLHELKLGEGEQELLVRNKKTGKEITVLILA